MPCRPLSAQTERQALQGPFKALERGALLLGTQRLVRWRSLLACARLRVRSCERVRLTSGFVSLPIRGRVGAHMRNGYCP